MINPSEGGNCCGRRKQVHGTMSHIFIAGSLRPDVGRTACIKTVSSHASNGADRQDFQKSHALFWKWFRDM